MKVYGYYSGRAELKIKKRRRDLNEEITMKKGIIFTMSISALLMAMGSCSNDDAGVIKSIDEFVAQKQVPITFSTYKGNAALTRAGSYGAINTDTQLQGKGFGVFAYYTEETTFDNVPVATRSLVPDFMYNEHIVWDPTAIPGEWTYYDPNDTKYWPNDFNGNGQPVDNRGAGAATGTKKNYISFFAYAPYAGVLNQNVSTSKYGATSTANDGVTSGIIAASGNNFNGDPFLKYRLSNTSSKMVDLLWGTAGGALNGDNVVGDNQPGSLVTRSVDNGTATAVVAVDPTNIDMTKMETDGKITFNFKHALAKVGGSTAGAATTNLRAGLTVDLLIDSDGTTASAAKSGNTIVTVESIQITHNKTTTTPGGTLLASPMPSTGVLNLATGVWDITAADAADPDTYITIDHSISQTGANLLNPDIMEPTSTVTSWSDLTMEGVVETTQKNVYAAEAYPLLFLPGTQPSLVFTITYIVRSRDAKLSKGFSEVRQTITKTVTFASPVQQNKQYNIAMHLGLTSVKFDASVSNWDTDYTGVIDPITGNPIPAETPVDLPINVN